MRSRYLFCLLPKEAPPCGRSPSAIACPQFSFIQASNASSSSSVRWKARQGKDVFAREAKVAGLKSRAAFKLLQINAKHNIFRPGSTVVDLGYAPGSWAQVALNRTKPDGRVVGVDVLPAQPPQGVSTIQGNFLSPDIQAEVRAYVRDPNRGRPRIRQFASSRRSDASSLGPKDSSESPCLGTERGYVELERHADLDASPADRRIHADREEAHPSQVEREHMDNPEHNHSAGRVVDVVLSDMCEPWEQTSGLGKRSVSDPYRRMISASGTPFRDHAGSMDLCIAALSFCFDTLRQGGHFVTKFYQGAEDKLLERRMRRLFEKVHREKPSASRSESREGYLVGLRRKGNPTKDDIFEE